jgi:hypothetical protein
MAPSIKFRFAEDDRGAAPGLTPTTAENTRVT